MNRGIILFLLLFVMWVSRVSAQTPFYQGKTISVLVGTKAGDVYGRKHWRAFEMRGAAAACALVLGQRDLLRVAVLLAALPLACAITLARARYRLSLTREGWLEPWVRLRAEQTGHTLETTGLVHEAYLRLVGSEHLEFESRAHFLAIAAQSMRHILIDSALSRRTQKRGGGVRPLPLDSAPIVAEERSEELLALDEALQRLSAIHERQERLVDGRR